MDMLWKLRLELIIEFFGTNLMYFLIITDGTDLALMIRRPRQEVLLELSGSDRNLTMAPMPDFRLL